MADNNHNVNSNNQTTQAMTPEAAARIQSHADRTGTNQGFKSRAQSSAATNASGKSGGGKSGGKK